VTERLHADEEISMPARINEPAFANAVGKLATRSAGVVGAMAAAVLIVGCSLSAAAQQPAGPSSDEVVAVFPADFPPQYSLDEQGRPTGFAIDSMDAIARLAGLRVTYRPVDSWTTAMDALLAGEADLVPNAGISPARAKTRDYSLPVETFSVVFFSRRTSDDIREADDLVGRTIALERTNVAYGLLKDRADITLMQVPTNRDALFELLSGNVDAIAGPEPVIWKLASDIGVDIRIRALDPPLKEVQRAIAVNKGNTALLDRLNPVVAEFIGSEEYAAIYAKWYGHEHPSWTGPRVAWLTGLLLLVSFVGMAGWRHLSLMRLNRELQESEETTRKQLAELAFIYDTTPVGLCHMDLDLRFVRINERLAEMNGIPVEAHVGRGLREILPELADGLEPQYRQMIETDEPLLGMEVHGTTPSQPGVERDWIVSHYPIKGRDGQVQGLGTLVEEVTERKRAEQAVQESEALLRLVMDNLPVLITYMDADRRYRLVNRTCADWYDRPPSEIVGKHVSEIHGDKYAMFKPRIDTVLAGESLTFEDTVAYPDGERRHIRSVHVPHVGPQGAVHGYFSLTEDITERKRAEEALRESEHRFKDFAESASDWFWEVDTDLRYTYVSPSIEASLGLSAESFIGISLAEIVERRYPDGEWDEFFEIARDRLPFRDLVARRVGPDGAESWISASGVPVFDTAGAFRGYRGTMSDITDRRRAEDEVKRLNQGLEQRVERRTAELKAAQAELVRKERLATLGQLTATVSHELRNPLGAMGTSVHVLAKLLPDGDPHIRSSIERIERGVIRCDRIIDELLDFTRVRDVSLEPTTIDDYLAETLDELAVPEGVAVKRVFGAPGVAVPLDRDRLRRAVINVYDNACQAMPAEATARDRQRPLIVTVGTRVTDARVEVSISDAGSGIPPDILPKIFEPLFSSKTFGVGLGLTTVKQILEQHGGGVTVETEEGQGTRFTLWLPYAQSERSKVA
jgi:PAS domain S-box-containing protein